MSTIPCTVAEFNRAFTRFFSEIGNTKNTQEGIANMFKGLTLHYFGLDHETSDEDVQKCATTLQVAAMNAMRRGWILDEPDLSGNPRYRDHSEEESEPDNGPRMDF